MQRPRLHTEKDQHNFPPSIRILLTGQYKDSHLNGIDCLRGLFPIELYSNIPSTRE